MTDTLWLFGHDEVDTPPPSGEVLRDCGIEAVTRSTDPFVDRVRAVVEQMPVGTEVTGEDIRTICADQGIVPGHHNAWGAAVMACVKRELIAKTGEYRKMRDPRSHARETPVYTRKGAA